MGQILEFQLINAKNYALIETFNTSTFDMPSSEYQNLTTILKNGLINRFFLKITDGSELVYIDANYLLNKCIIVGQYISEIKYEFEHD